MTEENFDLPATPAHAWQAGSEISKKESPYAIPMAIIIAGSMLSLAIFYSSQNYSIKTDLKNQKTTTVQIAPVSALEEAVVPSVGVELSVLWGNLGAKLVSVGTIDEGKFKALYSERKQWSDEYNNLLVGNNIGKLKITKNNAGYLLNLFWALGLSNKNIILESGEITNPRYGGAENFASTAGWTVAKGDPMDHYSRHTFFILTPEQQILVNKVSRGIYRSCCDNSTHFPDCNHGMAMLGLLELMASQGVSEQDMYKVALVVNSYWFPDTYVTIATYMKNKSVEWKNVNPQEILGINYSSASGYAQIASQVAESKQQGGSSCSVDAGELVESSQKQSGCGI